MIYLSISISFPNLTRGRIIHVLRHHDVIIFQLRHRYIIILELASMRMKMVNHGFYFVEF